MSEVSKLLEPNNRALRVRIESVSKDCNREKVRQDLIDSMEHYQGVGLSANQIGIMERVFIMYENVDIRKILTCFNPKILETSREFQGLPSRIFQHEYDHMEGTDFTQKVSRLKIDRAMKKLNKTVKRLQKSK